MPDIKIGPIARFVRPRIVEFGAIVVLAALIVAAERDVWSLPFTLICGLFIATLALAASGRPTFSMWMALATLSLSAIASAGKFKHLAVNAHILDIKFYLSKGDTLAYLADDYRWSVLGAAVTLFGYLGFAALMYRREAPRAGLRAKAGMAALGLAAVAPLILPAGAAQFSYHINKNHFASSFFASLSDLARLSLPDPVEQAAARAVGAAPFAAAEACAISPDAPDIVVVLSESAVIPSTVPGWRTPPELEGKFRSFDGAQHAARVETFGGGTWISHTSVLSGLSMAEFGWMRPYATLLLNGRLRHGLPDALVACGYKTAFVSPLDFHFVNEGPMIKSLGVEDYLDLRTIRAPSKHEADSFYFGKALNYYRSHVGADRRPLFLFIVTMAAHPPYDSRFLPDRAVVGEPLDPDPVVAEYLRRLVLAQTDYEAFVATLNEQRGTRPLLVAQFGDHHPGLTQSAFMTTASSNPLADFRSPIYRTFYAVTTHGFTPRAPLPRVDALDLAFIAPTLLEVAGAPLDPAFRAAAALRDHCGGAFHTCADRAAVDLYLARMAKSGLIDVPARN